MNGFDGLKGWMIAAALAVCTVVSVAGHAQTFVEGEHYERLPVPVDTADEDRVEVVEMFSYACVHCYNFESALATWRGRLAEGVNFRRVPAIFNPTWQLLAQAYYTAEVLEVTERVHTPLFEAIHKQGVDVRDPARLAEIFERAAGVSPEDFTQVFDSFTVRGRVQQADARGRAYRLSGVPTLIVNGKFRVDGNMAGSNAAMLEVVDYLVAAEQGAGIAAPAAGS